MRPPVGRLILRGQRSRRGPQPEGPAVLRAGEAWLWEEEMAKEAEAAAVQHARDRETQRADFERGQEYVAQGGTRGRSVVPALSDRRTWPPS